MFNTDYLHEAKLAMDKAANAGDCADAAGMIAQAHFASAAALVAIAERLDKLLEILEGATSIDVTVLR